MIDVDENGVEAPPRPVGIEPLGAGREIEEIAFDQAAPRVAGQLPAEREKTPSVPVDHRLQLLDDQQRADLGRLQDRIGGVTQSEAANHDVEGVAVKRRQAELGQRHFGGREAAGHEEFFAQLDLENVDAELQVAPTAQRKVAQGRFAKIEFFE